MAESAIGTADSAVPGVRGATKAAAEAANVAGTAGDGRRIEVVFCNTQNTPNGESACAREAVAEKVVAVVGQAGFADAQMPILSKAGIPMQTFAFQRSVLDLPNFYSVNGAGGLAEFAGMAFVPRRVKAQKVAIAYTDFPGLIPNIRIEENALGSQGITPVTTVAVPLSTTQFSGIVEKLQSSGADAVLLNAGGPQLAGILQAAQSVGYDPYWIVPLGASPRSQLKVLGGLTSKLQFAATVPAFLPDGDTEYESINTMREQMAKYGGADGALDLQDETTIFSWMTTSAVIDVIGGIKGDVTARTYTAALRGVQDMDVGGFWKWTPSTKFPNTAEPGPWVGHLEGAQPVYDGRIDSVMSAFK